VKHGHRLRYRHVNHRRIQKVAAYFDVGKRPTARRDRCRLLHLVLVVRARKQLKHVRRCQQHGWISRSAYPTDELRIDTAFGQQIKPVALYRDRVDLIAGIDEQQCMVAKLPGVVLSDEIGRHSEIRAASRDLASGNVPGVTNLKPAPADIVGVLRKQFGRRRGRCRQY